VTTLLLFASIHHVLAAEAALKAGGIVPDLVPVPKDLSPDCGMAIAIPSPDAPRALALLRSSPPTAVIENWRADG
jgi:hypothetical protein